jgi:hypothetical protein
MMIERYYLKADHEAEWSNVTRERFIAAEQAAGFRSQFGDRHVATGSFTGRGMKGRVEYITKGNNRGDDCHFGDHDESQPAPNPSGEWGAREGGLVVSAQGNVRFMARVEPHGPNGELNDGDKAVLAQIVRDHNIVPKLVAALKEALIEAEVSTVLWQQSRGFVGTVEDAYDKGLMPPAFVRARAALAAVGREGEERK